MAKPFKPEVPTNDAAPPHFDVAADVVFQLGEALITDDVQAIVELVKNAYDADAEFAKVEIEVPPPVASSKPQKGAVSVKPSAAPADKSPSEATIKITDNGHGMTREQIVQGWLVIADSDKRRQKRNKVTTTRGRTPLGDKGLGRLGVQRLGDSLEIITRHGDPLEPSAPTQEMRLSFNWKSFRAKRMLSEVPVELSSTEPTAQRPGTAITIRELRNPDRWRRADAVEHLTDELSKMLSPYRAQKDFVVYASVNGQALTLAALDAKVIEAATVAYEMRFDGQSLRVAGRFRMEFFRSSSGPRLADYRRLVESDGGRALAEYLTDKLSARRDDKLPFELQIEASQKSFVRATTTIDHPVDPAAATANLGPFDGQWYVFDLGTETASEQDVFDSPKEYREWIKRLSGIRVYRDGFSIRVDTDWLGLASERTSGKGYYSIRPANTLGYIALTASGNAELVEKTDREGFQDTPSYRAFLALLQKAVAWINELHNDLRREYIKFVESRQRESTGLEDASPQEIARQLSEVLASAPDTRVPLKIVRDDAPAALARAATLLGELPGRGAISEDACSGVVNALGEARALLELAAKQLNDVATYVASSSRLASAGSILEGELASLRDRVEDLFELASLGMSAETMSHEILTLVERLDDRSQKARRGLQRQSPDIGPARTLIETAGVVSQRLRLHLKHLSPSLRYVRDRRDLFQVTEWVRSFLTYHVERLSAFDITLSVERVNDFAVRINKGKLTQVLDNLIQNSEYWLRLKRTRGAAITVIVNAPYIHVSDTGPGVDPKLESSIFAPFISGRPKGSGRGLGLYISRQLLSYDDCLLTLAEERNDRGRRHIFDVDLSAVVIRD